MAIVLSLTVKIIIMVVVAIAGYLIMKYAFDYDILLELWEGLINFELDAKALVLSVVFSIAMWLVIWLNPFWVNSTFFSPGYKIFLTVALPVVGYPIALRALNK